MKKFIILVFLSVFPVISYAQFYDKEDEIHFYVSEDNHTECRVINFDGNRATYFRGVPSHTGYYSVENIREYLTKDPNYFENKVYSAVYNLTYTKDFPSVSYIEYHQEPTNGFKSTFLYTFSYDKKTLNLKYINSGHIQKFKEVPKEYFLPGRRRSDLNNERIYE